MIQPVDEVVTALQEVIDHPVPDRYTNPASAEFVQRYFRDIAGFEDVMFAQTPG